MAHGLELDSITEAINKIWDVLYGTHEWIQPDPMELQESNIAERQERTETHAKTSGSSN